MFGEMPLDNRTDERNCDLDRRGRTL